MEDLVSEFARQPSAIQSRLNKLGLAPSFRLSKSVDYDTPDDTADDPEQSHEPPAREVSEWRRLRPRGGKVWSPEEDEALLQEFAAGLSLEEIARRRERGVFAVEVRLTKLGRDTTARRNEPSESADL